MRADSAGRESWYGTWWAGGVRVKRKLALKRSSGCADGLTRVQAERELRRRIETDVVIAGAQRRTVLEAGTAYVEHLEFVMERKRTTLQDYRGYLRRHLDPFFGERPVDKIDAARVTAYLRCKREAGLSSKTVCNHPNFLLRGWFDGSRRATRGVRRRRPPGRRRCILATAGLCRG